MDGPEETAPVGSKSCRLRTVSLQEFNAEETGPAKVTEGPERGAVSTGETRGVTESSMTESASDSKPPASDMGVKESWMEMG